jgi:hypothetical protein
MSARTAAGKSRRGLSLRVWPSKIIRNIAEASEVTQPWRIRVAFDRLRDWECFDGDTGKDSAREIREYFIPDFSNWKGHDSYRTAFQRLVTDLKAEASE